ncbi:hypothetical protein H5410_058532 [Solanum commersonii]|uniref:Uncharacterized protein n=1 Tax=Solanum commersonii TaxID=4109 RepID=A0A9J5WTX0_SOLCO|nr:hypothetical protein H5410_058532 [Solanum commersonii]
MRISARDQMLGSERWPVPHRNISEDFFEKHIEQISAQRKKRVSMIGSTLQIVVASNVPDEKS